MLEIGQQVTDFSLPTDQGQFTLSEHRGKNVVLFFYPKADTPGCTKESIAFSGLLSEFDAANAVVIGMSKDTPVKQGKFRDKHGLTVLLGADHETEVCELFGVWGEKSMYGRTYMGIERSSFIIDPDGKLSHVWRKVKVPGHAEEVLAALKEQ